MKKGWEIKRLDDACEVEYGTRVVNKRDGGTIYPVYGGGGATFFMDTFNREDCFIVARFAMSEQCTRFVKGKFFLNDSGLSVKPKNPNEILQDFLNLQLLYLNDHIYSLARGAAQKNLDVPAFRNIEVNFPKSLPEQQRIVAILDEVFAAIAKAKANAEQNLKNAKELFESYLQGVFENKGEGWEERRLGESDLIEIIDGDRGKNYPTQKDFTDEGYCLFMNTKNVRPTGFEFNTTMFISEAKDKAMGKGKLKRNDVVMTTRGTIGNLGVYDKEVEYDNIRINSGMLIFRPNLKQITSEYLFEILRSGIIKRQIKKQVTGAAQPQLPIKTLVNFVFPVPKSIKEQQAIVQKLDALSTETKKLESIYQQKINDLEELKKSVLQKAFNGEL
jgi:type I restriction enzyme S subunit